MKHWVYHIMLIYLWRGPSLISVLTSDNPITPYMPVHTMNALHFKTSLGFSIPLLLCTLHKNLPALRGIYIIYIYICIYDNFCKVETLFFPKELASFPSESTSQPSTYAVASGHKILGLHIQCRSFFHDSVFSQNKVVIIIADSEEASNT